MANPEHIAIISQGAKTWNRWRKTNPRIRPSLRKAKLKGMDLSQMNLSGVNLSGADLMAANLREANLSGAKLIHASLESADARQANFTGVDFTGAKLFGANLFQANLSHAALVETNFLNANLSECRVYGISAWNINTEGTSQTDLIITREGEPMITVDHIEVAQFIYLILNNKKIRDVIDTITSKAVLILGRFTGERKSALDAIREELRKHNYLPILFDFEKPSSRDTTETISTLAHLARFVIADITDAKSIPQELLAIVPNLPSLPIKPLLLSSQQEYGMFEHFYQYDWVLEPLLYRDQEELIDMLEEKIIAPIELRLKKTDSQSR